jgi:hypothetical protein
MLSLYTSAMAPAALRGNLSRFLFYLMKYCPPDFQNHSLNSLFEPRDHEKISKRSAFDHAAMKEAL